MFRKLLTTLFQKKPSKIHRIFGRAKSLILQGMDRKILALENEVFGASEIGNFQKLRCGDRRTKMNLNVIKVRYLNFKGLMSRKLLNFI